MIKNKVILFLVILMPLTACKVEYKAEEPSFSSYLPPSPKIAETEPQPDADLDNKEESSQIVAPRLIPVKATIKKDYNVVMLNLAEDWLDLERVPLDGLNDHLNLLKFVQNTLEREGPIGALEYNDFIYDQYLEVFLKHASNQFELIYLITSLVNSIPEKINNEYPEGVYLYPIDSFLYGIKTDLQRILLLMDILSHYCIEHDLGVEDGNYTLAVAFEDFNHFNPAFLFKNDLGLEENVKRTIHYATKNNNCIKEQFFKPLNSVKWIETDFNLEVASNFNKRGYQTLSFSPVLPETMAKLYQSQYALIRSNGTKLTIEPSIQNQPKGILISDDDKKLVPAVIQ